MSFKKLIALAGALIALFTGSGFATGQELLQYFTAYGSQFFLVLIILGVTFAYYNLSFAAAGSSQKFEKGNDVFKYYCGKYLGTFFDYYSTAFCYMSFFVMVGGASSTLNQAFGVPAWAGAVALTAVAVLIVCLGLNRLVEVIGTIGPVQIIFLMTIGIIALSLNWDNLQAGFEAIASSSFAGASDGQRIVQAGDHWLTSGLSYAGFVLLWYASFTSLLGAKYPRRSLKIAIIVATLAICAAISIIVLAQVANINSGNESTYLWKAAVPNLLLATKIWAPISIVYAVIVFFGTCATSVPLLYNPAARFAEEGTARFRILAIVLGIVGLLFGLFVPYATLVNVIYVINGYIGAILLVFMIVKDVRTFLANHNQNS